jgi:ubiquinone/menaquinone biosynthesis C-methylase UbiE
MSRARDPKSRFTGLAEVYERTRPSYPVELFAWIEREAGLAPGAAIVDLGCGTGISTRLWASRGHSVVGVDPNEDMLGQARRLGGPRYLKGEASATGLPDASADLASAAQAFHWFDIPSTLAELRRILKPGARCAAFWNSRAKTPLLADYESLLRRFSTEYAELGRGWETIEKVKAAGVREASEARFPNAQRLDRDGLLGRAHGSSYVALGVKDLPAFDRELSAVFDRHQRGGAVTFDYETRVLLFRP